MTAQELPPPLPAATVTALNRPDGTLHTTRTRSWNGWDLDVPPGVFRPGLTSEMIADRVLSGEIETRGRRYLAMGCGLGLEVVAAGIRGAGHVYAVDVHPASVETAVRHHDRLAGPGGCTGIVADLLDGVPDGTVVDVVTFNPPAVSVRVAEDPDVVRNVCEGAPLLDRFFAQLAGRDVLAPGGEVLVIASNTADLPAIVRSAAGHGFDAGLVLRHDWGDGVLTHLFRFTRSGGAR
ncbi:methyltransferase [Pseudonocardia sp. HH130630-07]|uniref:methyltransferase n=1 Tax=Pseudonocardia sp. HH130630-07 TaxID=1690815 RepID=UPI000A63D640|nr:methyltransferase [Pseudonocardia sp. HH130630-07]